MVKNRDLSGYRVLLLAIAVSLGWHLFWLSAVKIVSAPGRTEPVKFSKVSFLGPLLTRVGMEVRVQPAARSLLERRFNAVVAGSTVEPATAGSAPPDARRYGGSSDEGIIETRLPGRVDEALAAPKLEPEFKAH